MLRKMVIPGERIEEVEGPDNIDGTDTDSVKSYSEYSHETVIDQGLPTRVNPGMLSPEELLGWLKRRGRQLNCRMAVE